MIYFDKSLLRKLSSAVNRAKAKHILVALLSISAAVSAQSELDRKRGEVNSLQRDADRALDDCSLPGYLHPTEHTDWESTAERCITAIELWKEVSEKLEELDPFYSRKALENSTYSKNKLCELREKSSDYASIGYDPLSGWAIKRSYYLSSCSK